MGQQANDRDRGEQEVGRICEEGRNNSCCGRNGTTEEPKAEKACIRNAPLTRPTKTQTRSRSVEMEKDAQKWIEVVGWPRMDDTYKMLITSEISVQRYIERWPWPPPVQPSSDEERAVHGVQRTVPHIPGFVSSACTVL